MFKKGSCPIVSLGDSFTGKEEQKALNSALPLIDYGARMYDPTIARWMSADPLAESLYPFGPYSFCYDNPLIELLN